MAAAKSESCSTCHDGVGGAHQAIYNGYVDESNITLAFSSVTSTLNADNVTYTVVARFDITLNGAAYVDTFDLAGLDQKRFYATQHFSGADLEYLNSCSMSLFDPGDLAVGEFAARDVDCGYAPEDSNAQVYGYVADGVLLQHESGTGGELPEGSHVHLYEDVANSAIAFGTAAEGAAGAYVSAASSAGCEKCHGAPYLKHGYRQAKVTGLPDFAACKACHVDDRTGRHEDWQYMVDDPFAWATGEAPTADYSYTANIMNVTHMSHAMEFPFPMSMSNCNTCHDADMLPDILSDANFTAETCKSCHPVTGTGAWPEDVGTTLGGPYDQPHRAPPIAYLWERAGVTGIHNINAQCFVCHSDPLAPPNTGFAVRFNELHTGYAANIYDADGVKYADQYTVSIDNISMVGDLMTIEFSSNDPGIVPEVLVSFYGWDTKHFIVPSHERDANEACQGRRPGCQMEYVPESSGGGANPLFTEDAASVPGAWIVTLDVSVFQPINTDTIPNLIANGVAKKAEVSLAPEFVVDGKEVVLEAVSETFDIAANGFDNGYFTGANAIVSVDKCNVCHDVLASSFHDGSGRGGDGIQVCKHCHATTFAGSHIEMASRSIENYVHSIHSFQAFDVGDEFEIFDPVLATRYDTHIKHTFPNFTIRNCEACHLPGTYEVPDQSKSMPGLQASSDTVNTWYDLDDPSVEDPTGRNIGTIPQYVTGPASRACGGCHRADFINADDAGGLVSFNAHTAAFGTLVENVNEDGTQNLFPIIDKLMSFFE